MAMPSDASGLTSVPTGPTRSRLAHNAILNFLGLAVPLALAFFIMPIAAKHLGPARFGLLGLAWAVTEYLTFFDLGLGRALVKFVAEALHHDSGELNEIVSLSIVVQVVAGIVGGAALALGAPLLVHNVFAISPHMSAEAENTFRVVGLSIPVVLLMSGQRAVLEGAQRFDLSATIKMLTSIVALAIPAVGAVIGASLPSILLVVLIARILVCVLYALAIRSALPHLRWVSSRNWDLLRRVFSFGAWVIVSNTVNPLLIYFDRFALGAIVGLAAVGFYTAPYEGVTRLLLIPVSLLGSLLPALTSMEAGRERQRFSQVGAASERVLTAVMAVPLSVILVFGPEILRIWLGALYAEQSSMALRLLAVGVFANSLAHPLFVMLYAKNRPDLPAKIHLIELAIHIPLTILFIRVFGIAGAAAAWTTRVMLDLCLLQWATAKTSNHPTREVAGGRVGRSVVGIALLLAGLSASKALGESSFTAAGIAVLVTVTLFALGSWHWMLCEAERRAMSATLRSYLKSLPRLATPS
jgi:O-antigen/teichoic acid export membrane protein